MSEIRVLIEQLVKAGVDPVEAAEVVSRAAIHGAASAPRARSAGAIRQERYRRNKASQVTEDNASDSLLSPEGSSPIPPSPKPQSSNPPSPPKGGSSPADFDQFWTMFPNKVGKRDAEKAFAKAIQRASFEIITAGLSRYAAKTDDRPWCNPSTWLNQDRWDDAPATVPQRQATAPPPGQDFNAILDAIQGKPHVPQHSGPAFDGSYERTDRGSAPNLVQLHAVSTRR